MLNIADIRPNMRRIDASGTVLEMNVKRTVNLRIGGTADVVDAVLGDATGSIKMSLWDGQIQMVQKGSKVVIENGYSTSFKGETQLNVGRYGDLKVL